MYFETGNPQMTEASDQLYKPYKSAGILTIHIMVGLPGCCVPSTMAKQPTQTCWYDDDREMNEHGSSYTGCDENVDLIYDCADEMFVQSTCEPFLLPVLFEHGMDIVECDHYYRILASQARGGVLRRPQGLQVSLCGPTTRSATDRPISILRKSRRAKKAPVERSEGKLIRRSSFCGVSPETLKARVTVDSRLVRSKSMQDDTRNVGFHQFARVYSIPSIEDLPYEIRAALWMSPEEMMISIRDAAIAEMEKEIASRDNAQPLEQHKNVTPTLRRQESSDSVIAEYLQTTSTRSCQQDCVPSAA
jgi:hypothetical protein